MRLKFGFLLVICALLGMSGCGKSKNGVTVDQAYMASFRPNDKVPWNHGVATAPQIQLLILLTELTRQAEAG